MSASDEETEQQKHWRALSEAARPIGDVILCKQVFPIIRGFMPLQTLILPRDFPR